MPAPCGFCWPQSPAVHSCQRIAGHELVARKWLKSAARRTAAEILNSRGTCRSSPPNAGKPTTNSSKFLLLLDEVRLYAEQ
jgi:hypothetical protein